MPWLAGAVAPWKGNVVRYESKAGSLTPRQQYQQQQHDSYGWALREPQAARV